MEMRSFMHGERDHKRCWREKGSSGWSSYMTLVHKWRCEESFVAKNGQEMTGKPLTLTTK
nr:hypothetical protein [Tanacetum cinerariifolium]